MDAWATAPSTIVTSREFPTEPEAEATLEEYRALMNGTTVTAVNPLGRTFSVKVNSVVGDVSATVSSAVSARQRNVYRLVATWSLQVEAGP